MYVAGAASVLSSPQIEWQISSWVMCRKCHRSMIRIGIVQDATQYALKKTNSFHLSSRIIPVLWYYENCLVTLIPKCLFFEYHIGMGICSICWSGLHLLTISSAPAEQIDIV